MKRGMKALETWFGKTENALICHIGLEHGFDQINRWGTSDGAYWAEHFIGVVKRFVNRKKDPEANMMAAYLRTVKNAILQTLPNL